MVASGIEFVLVFADVRHYIDDGAWHSLRGVRDGAQRFLLGLRGPSVWFAIESILYVLAGIALVQRQQAGGQTPRG
jgi:hypothetical protein